MPATRKQRLAASLITLAVGAITFLPVCDLNFACGCVLPWNGAAAHCDIHTPGPPNCPWCHHPWQGYAAMAAASLAGVVSILLARASAVKLTLIGLLAFHVTLFAAGAITSIATGRSVFAGFG